MRGTGSQRASLHRVTEDPPKALTLSRHRDVWLGQGSRPRAVRRGRRCVAGPPLPGRRRSACRREHAVWARRRCRRFRGWPGSGTKAWLAACRSPHGSMARQPARHHALCKALQAHQGERSQLLLPATTQPGGSIGTQLCRPALTPACRCTDNRLWVRCIVEVGQAPMWPAGPCAGGQARSTHA